MSLTLKERERLAYIEGRTETADLLAELDDSHRWVVAARESEYQRGYRDGRAEAILELMED